MLARERRRNQILQAAGSQFLANGFAGTSMQGIAKVAGISRASLYTYFGNKEAVFIAVFKLLEGFICREAQRAIAALDQNASFDARLVAAFDARLTTWLAATKTKSPYTYEILQVRAERTAQAQRTPFEELIAKMFLDAAASGEFTPRAGSLPTQDLAVLLLQSASGIALYEGGGLTEKRKLLRVLIQTFIRGTTD